MSTIITRNSATSGSQPSSLVQGELAINVTDGRLFYGSGSGNIVKEFGITSSYTLNALSASYAATASSANSFIVRNSLTASGLRYPTADNGEFSFIQTDGAGNLSLQYVNTTNDIVYNAESFSLVKGTPVYVSGSNGANPKVYAADAGNPAKMPVTYIIGDTIASNSTGRAIILGQIDGVNTTGYPAGTEIYTAVGGGWTSIRPTGSAIVQVLGIVTKEGSGGKGLVLNPGPAELPNLPSGSIWVGNNGSVPTAILTSSLNVASAVSSSYSATSSYLNTLNQNLTFNGNLTLNGTASISYLNVSYESASIIYSSGSNQLGDAVNDTQLLYGSVIIPTGSLTVTGSINTTGSIYINGSAFSTQITTLATENKIVYSIPTSTYDSLFVEYVVKNGTNVRAGYIMSATDGTNVKSTETTTTDLGSTTPVTFNVSVDGGNIRLEASASTSTWTVKTITRTI